MIDRSLLTIGWLVVCWLFAQTAPITRLVFHPEKVEIVGDQVALTRSFPIDAYFDWRPRMSYVETVRPLTNTHNNGQSCVDPGGPFPYTRAGVVGTWGIPWAADCLSDPVGFQWSTYWYWHIGRLVVGPVSLSQKFIHEPCQYRVSTTGIIHGPDSPHWSQTSTDRCFATRAAAEAALE